MHLCAAIAPMPTGCDDASDGPFLCRASDSFWIDTKKSRNLFRREKFFVEPSTGFGHFFPHLFFLSIRIDHSVERQNRT